MSSWHLNPVHSTFTVLCCAGLLLALMMWLGKPSSRISSGKHWTLFGLRFAVLLLMALIMLRPTLVVTEEKTQKSHLLVVADFSRSMTQTDEVNGASRWQALAADLKRVSALWAELAEQYQLEFVTFDETSQAVGNSLTALPLDKKPTGKLTAIGSALDDLLRRYANQRVAGILLFSDGAQQALPPRDRAPQSPVRQFNELGTALFTFCYGQERAPQQNRDLAVVELLAGPTVYVKNVLNISGTIRANGMVNQIVQVKVYDEAKPGKSEIVASATLTPATDGELLPIELSYTPETPGEHKLTLKVEGPNGIAETVTTNNQLSTYVTVLEGGINILYLEGEPRVESRFLRRALNASPDMRVDFQWYDAKKYVQQRRQIDLTEQVKPDRYKCYIIGDLDAAVFRPKDLEALATAIERGAGLIFLGGYHAYWAGGYQDTPLARVMPLEFNPQLDRLLRQNYNEPLRQDLHLQGPVPMLPDKQWGSLASFMKLATPEKNNAAWQELPPLKGANKWRALKPTAKVLARSPNSDPLIAALEPGAGRVLAMAGDSTWVWAMQGHDALHKTFWRQAILWVLKIDETQSGNVWLSLEQRRIMPGRRVNVTAGVRSSNQTMSEKAKYTAKVTLPNGQPRSLNLGPQETYQSGSFGETNEPGEYQIEVNAEYEGKLIGTAKGRFMVLQQDMELDNPLARPSVLASLAQITAKSGGRAMQREELESLLEKFRDEPPKYDVETQVKHTPWDRPEVLLLFVTLLVVEWFLRKKWGLV